MDTIKNFRISYNPKVRATYYNINNPAVIAVLLFFATLAYRLFFYYFNQDLSFGIVSVTGTPFSDAQDWNDGAITIAQGNGLTGVAAGRRPFYPVLLACFYTWFGPSFMLAKMINILAGSLTVSFIYLIGEKVFNRFMGIFAASLIILSPLQMNYSLTLMTESTGFLFFAASVFFIFMGLDKKNNLYLFAGGVFFILSNLTRTLTILAFPGYLVCIFYILQRDKTAFKKIFLALLFFTLGVTISLAPWLVRQKIVHGIYAVSENTAEAFYAATSPKYKTWSGLVDKETRVKGITSIKDKYKYYQKASRENLKKYPLFFIKNSSKTFLKYINGLNIKGKIFNNILTLFILILFISHFLKIHKKKEKILLMCLFAAVLVIQRLMPANTGYIITISGIILSFIAINNKYSTILAAGLIFTGIGFAIMGGGPQQRIFLLINWSFQLFYFFTFVFILQFMTHKIILKNNDLSLNSIMCFNISPQFPKDSSQPDIELMIKKISWAIAVFVMIFFFISSVKLIYLNYFKHKSIQTDSYDISFQEKQEILAQINRLIPGIFSKNELDNQKAFTVSLDFNKDAMNNGKILIKKGKSSIYKYFIPKDKNIPHWSRLFYYRPYNRTILYIKDTGYFLFPEQLTDDFLKKEFIFVGRQNIDTRHIYQGRVIIEGIAMIPVDPETNHLQTNNILIAKDIHHLKYLQHLGLLAKTELALSEIQESIRLAPKDPLLYYKSGNLYQRTGKMKQAIEEYKKAITIKPDFIQALNELGIIYMNKKNYEEAISLFKKIIETNPKEVSAFYNIACAYAKQNNVNESVIWLKNAVKSGFDKWDILKTDKDMKNIRQTLYYKKLIQSH